MIKKVLNKKGNSMWISWILLMAFAVVISIFMYDWIFGFSSDAASDLEQRTYAAEGCDDISIAILGICQDTQTLYINITNTKNLRVKQLVFRVYDIYDEPETKTKTLDVFPGRTESVQVLKQGRTGRLEIIPVSKKKDSTIMCNERMVIKEDIPTC